MQVCNSFKLRLARVQSVVKNVVNRRLRKEKKRRSIQIVRYYLLPNFLASQPKIILTAWKSEPFGFRHVTTNIKGLSEDEYVPHLTAPHTVKHHLPDRMARQPPAPLVIWKLSSTQKNTNNSSQAPSPPREGHRQPLLHHRRPARAAATAARPPPEASPAQQDPRGLPGPHFVPSERLAALYHAVVRGRGQRLAAEPHDGLVGEWRERPRQRCGQGDPHLEDTFFFSLPFHGKPTG